MAKAVTTTFGQFAIQVGDGASPEVFSIPCGLTSKGFNQSASTQETTVPDCDDPDAPAFVERGIDAISGEISGEGVLDRNALSNIWQPWFISAAPRNCRIYPAGLTGGHYEGAFVLTSLNTTAARGQKVNLSATMQSDGEYTWVDPT